MPRPIIAGFAYAANEIDFLRKLTHFRRPHGSSSFRRTGQASTACRSALYRSRKRARRRAIDHHSSAAFAYRPSRTMTAPMSASPLSTSSKSRTSDHGSAHKIARGSSTLFSQCRGPRARLRMRSARLKATRNGDTRAAWTSRAGVRWSTCASGNSRAGSSRRSRSRSAVAQGPTKATAPPRSRDAHISSAPGQGNPWHSPARPTCRNESRGASAPVPERTDSGTGFGSTRSIRGDDAPDDFSPQYVAELRIACGKTTPVRASARLKAVWASGVGHDAGTYSVGAKRSSVPRPGLLWLGSLHRMDAPEASPITSEPVPRQRPRASR